MKTPLILSIALTALAAPAIAQDAAAPAPPATSAPATPDATPPAPPVAESYEDKDIDLFADAVIGLNIVRVQAEAEITTATEEQKPAIAAAANQKMVQVVQASGIEAPVFNKISADLETDTALQAKVQSAIDAKVAAAQQQAGEDTPVPSR